MITPVIQFEIVIPKLNFKGEYVVPNTPDMVDKVLRHRFTRSIHFEKEFSIEPLSFKLPISFYEIEDDIDDIDQMH